MNYDFKIALMVICGELSFIGAYALIVLTH